MSENGNSNEQNKNAQEEAEQEGVQSENSQDLEETQELSPDELMAMQYAQNSYTQNTSSEEDISANEDKFSILLDIPLEVTVEIGSTEMAIEDILKLNPNSIIELDRYIDEPIDLKVNGKIIAKGELYTVQNNFGIKITQIITPEDRLKLLDT